MQPQKLNGMNTINEFILPIIGLKLGEYSYQFQVNDKFFDEFDNDELKEGELQVDLILIKRSNFMELLFNVKGIIKSICDRCAGGLDLLINHHEMRISKIFQGLPKRFPFPFLRLFYLKILYLYYALIDK